MAKPMAEVQNSLRAGRSNLSRRVREWFVPVWRTVSVAVFAAFLVAQGYLSFVTKPEPYPTVRMPNFGTAAARDGTFRISVARADVLYSDGTVGQISPTDLMAEFRFSTARPSYDYLFLTSEPSKITPGVKKWLLGRVEDLSDGVHPIEVRMCWYRLAISVDDATSVRMEPCVWRVVKL
jgi:hypothetical protein